MKKVAPFAYVGLQFGLLGLIIFLPSFGPSLHEHFNLLGRVIQVLALIGIVFAAPFIRTSLTIMPVPKKHAQLGTAGFYKYVRHPMYSFVIMFAIGSSIQSGYLYKYALTIALIIVLYYKSRYEEVLLRKKFKKYNEYSSKTPRFLPRINLYR